MLFPLLVWDKLWFNLSHIISVGFSLVTAKARSSVVALHHSPSWLNSPEVCCHCLLSLNKLIWNFIANSVSTAIVTSPAPCFTGRTTHADICPKHEDKISNIDVSDQHAESLVHLCLIAESILSLLISLSFQRFSHEGPIHFTLNLCLYAALGSYTSP